MYIFWTILGIIFLILDLIKANVIKLTFSQSLLFCAIAAYKFPKNYFFQFSCLIVLSGVFYVFNKIIFKKERKDLDKLLKLKDYTGKNAIVKKDIAKTLSVDGFGLVEFNNELWRAKSIDDKEIKAGNLVEIVSLDNKILNVKVKDHAN